MLKLLNLTMPSIGAAFVSIAAIAPSYAALLQFNTDAGSFRLDTRTGEVFSNFDPDNDFFKLLSFSGGASFQSGSGTINVNSETCSGGIDIIDSQTGEPQYLCYASGYERIQLFLQFQMLLAKSKNAPVWVSQFSNKTIESFLNSFVSRGLLA
ncbi:hypothetical protein NIES23_57770 (plasmid) [Trichormus variabilis NIES-23]|uniref:Uncharacterized protein n=1 Tax=Trichormus variabilis NIES-23 TaxID=1973479 RepID=A0A1Z4KVE0_ANAVA|nr:hypothetical protein NIES23_57770 [Trichormus variabilis NIES-23]